MATLVVFGGLYSLLIAVSLSCTYVGSYSLRNSRTHRCCLDNLFTGLSGNKISAIWNALNPFSAWFLINSTWASDKSISSIFSQALVSYSRFWLARNSLTALPSFVLPSSSGSPKSLLVKSIRLGFSLKFLTKNSFCSSESSIINPP